MIDAFIDTNVLLYAASAKPEEAAKSETARNTILTVRFGISTQVLQEFYVNATDKLASSIPEENLRTILALLKGRPIAPVTIDLFEEAVDIKQRYQISYWDAAIVAAAKQLGARVIFTEDLANAQQYDGVKVINPFLPAPTN